MGNVCVKDEQSPFCSTAATSSSRPRGLQDGARRSSQGRPFRVAAQRLGLELIEHAIMLGPTGTIVAPRVGGSFRASSAILAFAIRVRAGSAIWVCLPDQTHIRSSREATAPQFRLRRAGSRGRDHSSLRHLKPCNPSVRPPGSSEADRASADGLRVSLRLAAALAAGPGSGDGLHCGPLDDDALGDIHSQASWIIVVRSLGLPAFDTPCSCRMPPLCQGVAARPA